LIEKPFKFGDALLICRAAPAGFNQFRVIPEIN
jgi:hypothetical protein